MSLSVAWDLASLSISASELKRCAERIDALKHAKWSLAYSKRRKLLIVRRLSLSESAEAAARELEKALKAVLPDASARLAWARGEAKGPRLFPNPAVLVLFEPGTTVEKRRKILAEAGVQAKDIEAYEDVAPRRAGARAPVREPRRRAAGFSPKNTAKVLAKLKPVERRRERLRGEAKRIVVPAARVRLAPERREEAPQLAARIAGLRGVAGASADFNVLGRDLAPKRNFAAPPNLFSNSDKTRNLVVAAWDLVEQSDIGAPPATFMASREMVAVLDGDFAAHTNIAYQLIGYDAADGDFDPTSPPEWMPNGHGTMMAGVIGGTFTGSAVGVAPGAVVVPVRADYVTEADFVSVDGQLVPADWDEYVDNYAAEWVDAILRLYALSFSWDVRIANMSIAFPSMLWNDMGISAWLDWWLRDGNYGNGVFASASAGNNPDGTSIAIPANQPRVFAAGWGDFINDLMLGNHGDGMDVVVEDGAWGVYQSGNASTWAASGMGSSGASAIIAGTAALMQSLNPELTAADIWEILARTTRKTPSQLTGENASGYSTTYGNGFLNAYYAVDVARKDYMPAAELRAMRLRAGAPARALIQARLADWMSYSGKRSGMFWALTNPAASSAPQLWRHDRDASLRHVDQAIDAWGFPYGELTLVGDFDGDGVDELAIQLDAENWWPSFCDTPALSFLTGKLDPATNEIGGFGTRSAYASGLASPQIVFPGTSAVRDAVCADLGGDGRDCPVAVQGSHLLNALRYDAATDKFPAFTPVDFAADPLSARVDAATGAGLAKSRRLLKIARLGRVRGRDALLCIGEFGKPRSGGFADYFPGHWRGAGFIQRRYMTAFVLTYDTAAAAWVYEPFSADPQETHAVLERHGVALSGEVENIEVGDFSGQPNTLQAVVHSGSGETHFLTFFGGGAGGFTGYSIYSHELPMAGKASPLRSAVAGPDGAMRQLMWLEDAASGNRVRFFRWNMPLREWEDPGYSIWHGRRDNTAINVAAANAFAVGAQAVPPEVIAILMDKPHRNAHHTYRWNPASAVFEPLGVI